MTPFIVFMFGGQGSQYYGMARELYKNVSNFRKTVDNLDDTASGMVGESILGHLYDKEKRHTDEFSRTLYSHPALFIIQYSLARLLIDEGITPSFTVGTSLGEFVSAAVCGVISPQEALKAVIVQAQAIEKHCGNGGMLAIFHDSVLYDEDPNVNQFATLVAINYESHFVIACSRDDLQSVASYLRKRDIQYYRLPVSYAFHSSLIDPASSSYISYLGSINYNPPEIPFVSCMKGKIVDGIGKEYFWDVVRKPMLFREAVLQLENSGPGIYIDLGIGGTLSNFSMRNFSKGSASVSLPVITPFHQEMRNLEIVRKTIASKRQNSERKTKMTTYLFPGQGSQHIGMGGELFDEFPEITAKADEILGYSIKALCLEGPHAKLLQTQYTQPALFTVNALTYLKKVKESGMKPDYVAGHSLGEYSALFAAGAFDFETGLKLVKKRGELMGKATGGGMAAVLGLAAEKIEEVLRNNNVNAIDIANYNSPVQTVISGEKDEIDRISRLFNLPDVTYIPLNVSGAFHSRYMEPSRKEFDSFIAQFSFSELTIPVISNVTARPYRQNEIVKNLSEQITHSVKWLESIRYMMGKGEMNFEETGPGNILTKMVSLIQQNTVPLIVDDEVQTEIQEESSGSDSAENAEFTASAAMVRDASDSVTEISQAVDEDSGDLGRETDVAGSRITPLTLGDAQFKKDYNLKYAYLAGSMYRGISSKEMVVKLGKAGIMGSFGAGGVSLDDIEEAIRFIQKELPNGEPYALNLLHNPNDQEREENKIDLFLKYGVNTIDASAFISMSLPLIKYRAHGLKKGENGSVSIKNRIIGKVSRPEVAEAFLSPAPENVIEKLVRENKINTEQAQLLRQIPVADEICVEADSGGHTDAGVAYALMPAMVRLRDEMMIKHGYRNKIRIGAAGGIGTPEAAAAAFILGADFILTGSINQCTVEACTSEVVKDMLQQMNVQDTDYAPAGDMFELGAKVQVLKRGAFFPARANKLYELYRQFNSLEEIDAKTRKQLQERYFKRSFEDIFAEMTSSLSAEQKEKIERDPKQKMALVFRWYFSHSTKIALAGSPGLEVDYQVQCGPSLGAFNQWVKGTQLENWRNRHVDEIGIKLMHETSDLLNRRFQTLTAA